jgi:transposase-like protein
VTKKQKQFKGVSEMKNKENVQQNLDWYKNQSLETQISLFGNFLEVAKLLANQMLEDEVKEKAGLRYDREKPSSGRYSRWGSNPGSIRIGEEKVKIKVPRIHDNQSLITESPDSYQKLRSIDLPSEALMKKIILGLSQHDYQEVVKMGVESFGLSQSTVSKAFIEESTKALEEFENRDLGLYDFIALVIDGKYLSKENTLIALGITISGEKIPLGFIQTTTENSNAVKGLLKDLIKRNFKYTQGILALVDGSKGLRKAIDETFGKYALVQRCQWHKRENVLSYLSQEHQDQYRGKLQRAYSEPDYQTAKSKLKEIMIELMEINRSAARSLEEGFEETLTLHRLGLVEQLGRSFTTTNLIENLNSQLKKYIGRVKKWMNSDMRSRWMAVALFQIERRMRKVNNYEKLHLLRTALKTELKIKQKKAA